MSGRWIVFTLLACLFSCQAFLVERKSRGYADELPRYEDLVFVEGRLTQVDRAICRYTYVAYSRRGGPSTVCVDIFDLHLDTPRGARLIEAPDYVIPYRFNEIAEWRAAIGKPVRAGTGAPCPYPPTPCLYELAVGDDHVVRHERILKQTYGRGLAIALFIGCLGALVLIAVATIPQMDPPQMREKRGERT